MTKSARTRTPPSDCSPGCHRPSPLLSRKTRPLIPARSSDGPLAKETCRRAGSYSTDPCTNWLTIGSPRDGAVMLVVARIVGSWVDKKTGAQPASPGRAHLGVQARRELARQEAAPLAVSHRRARC